MNRLADLLRVPTVLVLLVLLACVGACEGAPSTSPPPAVAEGSGATAPLARLETSAIAAGMPAGEVEALLLIARNARPARRVLRDELAAAQRDLHDELARPSPREEEVVRLVLVASEVETRMRVHNMRTLLGMYEAVSPEYRHVLGTLTPGHDDARPRRGRRPR